MFNKLLKPLLEIRTPICPRSTVSSTSCINPFSKKGLHVVHLTPGSRPACQLSHFPPHARTPNLPLARLLWYCAAAKCTRACVAWRDSGSLGTLSEDIPSGRCAASCGK